jgi:WhiB family redox-sensing transcriptional regulator
MNIEDFFFHVPEWMNAAVCAGADPNDFHPEGAGLALKYAERRAKMVCAECPVRTRCLDWQMQFEGQVGASSRQGVYGGLNGSERARLAKKRAA